MRGEDAKEVMTREGRRIRWNDKGKWKEKEREKKKEGKRKGEKGLPDGSWDAVFACTSKPIG